MTPFEVAQSKLGLQEDNDRSELMAFFHSQSHNGDLDIDPSKTPWCACFVNACERTTGNPGNGNLAAVSFETYGNKVLSISSAQQGDILVFDFGNNDHHVTYLHTFDLDNNIVHCLGGNQNNMVKISSYSMDDIISIRRYEQTTNQDSIWAKL